MCVLPSSYFAKKCPSACPLSVSGYCGRGSPINGLCYAIDPTGTLHSPYPNNATDGLPYTAVGFLNGGGSVLEKDGPVRHTATAAAASPVVFVAAHSIAFRL